MNNAFEKLTGYMAGDVVGTEIQDKLQVDNCNEEETLTYHMKKYQVSSRNVSMTVSLLCPCLVHYYIIVLVKSCCGCTLFDNLQSKCHRR